MSGWGWSNYENAYASGFFNLLSRASPITVKSFLLVDCPIWFGIVLAMIRPMMSSSLNEALVRLSQRDLCDYLELDQLPVFLGGSQQIDTGRFLAARSIMMDHDSSQTSLSQASLDESNSDNDSDSWQGNYTMEELRNQVSGLRTHSFDLVEGKREALEVGLARLIDLPLFILDNSVRETTVASMKGHTLEAKLEIFDAVMSTGISHFIVGTFIHDTRVDDLFVKALQAKGANFENIYAFSEVYALPAVGVPKLLPLPVGQKKMLELGIRNAIFEIDVACRRADFTRFSYGEYHELVAQRIVSHHQGFPDHKVKTWVNLRDFCVAMRERPTALLDFVYYFAQMPTELRPEGIILEDPTGGTPPELLGLWVSTTRAVMVESGWSDGHLLIHIHQNYGLAEAAVQSGLMNGATGVWSAVCREGAGTGHASSLVTATNLARLGNRHVTQMYNMPKLRQAAIRVTKIVTGRQPHVDEEIYGARAQHIVFPAGGMGDESFDIFSFFKQKRVTRIHTLSDERMFQDRYRELFGSDELHINIAKRMKQLLLEDLRSGRRINYTSASGFVDLFKRAAPQEQVTTGMNRVLSSHLAMNEKTEPLLGQLHEMWLQLAGEDADAMEYDSAYNLIARFASCQSCDETQTVLSSLDPCHEGSVTWQALLSVTRDTLAQFRGECTSLDDLMSLTINHYLRVNPKGRGAVLPVVSVKPRVKLGNISSAMISGSSNLWASYDSEVEQFKKKVTLPYETIEENSKVSLRGAQAVYIQSEAREYPKK